MGKNIFKGEFKKSIAFCKEYRIHNKVVFNELEYKLNVLEFKRLATVDKVAAIEYCRAVFKKDKSRIKSNLNSLIDKQERIDLTGIVNEFKNAVLNLYRMEDRLTTRIYYGLIAFKTVFCRKNGVVECPGCNFADFTEIINRVENSEIICEGSGIILDSSNQAYADVNGRVYGIEFLNNNRRSIEDPKICYFV